jgi:hypothetical protein
VKSIRNAVALTLIALTLAACGANVGTANIGGGTNVGGGNPEWVDGLWKQAAARGGSD